MFLLSFHSTTAATGARALLSIKEYEITTPQEETTDRDDNEEQKGTSGSTTPGKRSGFLAI